MSSIFLVLILLFAVGCSYTPSLQLDNKTNIEKSSFSSASSKVSSKVSSPNQSKSYVLLHWYYPSFNTNIQFQIYHTTNLNQPFTYYTNSVTTNIILPKNQLSEFFKVRAINILTGQVSDWATTR